MPNPFRMTEYHLQCLILSGEERRYFRRLPCRIGHNAILDHVSILLGGILLNRGSLACHKTDLGKGDEILCLMKLSQLERQGGGYT